MILFAASIELKCIYFPTETTTSGWETGTVYSCCCRELCQHSNDATEVTIPGLCPIPLSIPWHLRICNMY